MSRIANSIGDTEAQEMEVASVVRDIVKVRTLLKAMAEV